MKKKYGFVFVGYHFMICNREIIKIVLIHHTYSFSAMVTTDLKNQNEIEKSDFGKKVLL
jgi:hypothetical protein